MRQGGVEFHLLVELRAHILPANYQVALNHEDRRRQGSHHVVPLSMPRRDFFSILTVIT